MRGKLRESNFLGSFWFVCASTGHKTKRILSWLACISKIHRTWLMLMKRTHPLEGWANRQRGGSSRLSQQWHGARKKLDDKNQRARWKKEPAIQYASQSTHNSPLPLTAKQTFSRQIYAAIFGFEIVRAGRSPTSAASTMRRVQPVAFGVNFRFYLHFIAWTHFLSLAWLGIDGCGGRGVASKF